MTASRLLWAVAVSLFALVIAMSLAVSSSKRCS